MSDDKQLDAALVAALSVPQFAPLAKHISVLREKVDGMRAELFAMRRDRQSERKADAYAEKRSAAARELADLRAYKERTEAGLVKLAERHRKASAHAESKMSEPNGPNTPTHFWTIMRDETAADIAGLMSLGLWRDPPQAEVQS